jgi:formylglycine-generating enzyme required for sulfatase activity
MRKAARMLIEDVLHSKDELLWVPALRYLRIFPDDRLWAEIPGQMWDKLLTVEDRRLTAAAMAREKSGRFVIPLLKAAADDDKEVSRFAVQVLSDKENAAWMRNVERGKREGDLLNKIRQRLQVQAGEKGDKQLLLNTLTVLNITAYIKSRKFFSQYWKLPYGEPEWITIPAGEFWMGGEGHFDGEPVHKVSLPEYQIARVPVTNAQYALYVQDAKVKPPEHWRGGEAPPGLEDHPVVNVSWDNALAYCKWLGRKIQRPVRLPSEAEREKAARGDKDKRSYPWGNDWRELHCNSEELGLEDTTPVGLFLNGASPYGVLDMSGNVWEWTRSVFKDYPYGVNDDREEETSRDRRVLRGGSFDYIRDYARCAYRSTHYPGDLYRDSGFRVAVSPIPSL